MWISLLVRLLLLLSLSPLLLAVSEDVSEEAELVSYAQDIYRRDGINISRSAFEVKDMEDWGRVFYVRIVSRRSSLSEDLLQGFLTGGAVSQHARQAFDEIIVMVEIEFSHEKVMILRASGSCCEELYNNRLSSELFTEKCLSVDYRN